MAAQKRYPCPACGEIAVVTCEVITRDPGLPSDDSEPYHYTDCMACRKLGPTGGTVAEAVEKLMDRVAEAEANP